MLTPSYQHISLLLLILLLVPSSWGYDNIYNTISSIGDVPKDNELFFLNRDALLHNSNRVISPRVVGGTEAGGHVVELSNDESMENRKVVELSNDEPMENTKVSWVDIVKKGENHK